MLSGTIPGFINLVSQALYLSGCNRLRGTLPHTAQDVRFPPPSANFVFGGLPPIAQLIDLSHCSGLDGTTDFPAFLGTAPLLLLNLTDVPLVAKLGAFNSSPGGVGVLVHSKASSRERRSGSGDFSYCPVVDTVGGARVVVSPAFYNWSQCNCSVFFAGRDGECFGCPSGGVCPGGSGQLQVHVGFWCDEAAFSRREAVPGCVVCQAGYCCPGPDPCAIEAQCAGHRTGVLCGNCQVGHSAGLGSTGCVSESGGCRAAAWVVPLVLLATCAFVVINVLIFKPARENSGGDESSADASRGLSISQLASAWGLSAFFYQIAPLTTGRLLDTEGKRVVLQFVIAALNLDMNAGGPVGDGGVCFSHGLTSVWRGLLGVGIPFSVFFWLAALVLVQVIHRKHASEVRRQGIIRTGLKALALGYSSLLGTALQLLHCTDLPGHGRRLLLQGDVACYTEWQGGVFVVVAALTLFPAALATWLRREIRSEGFSGSAAESLVASFRPTCRSWPAVTFAERLVLVTLFSLTPARRGARAWTLFFALWPILALHIVAKPYHSRFIRRVDLALLALLIMLAALGTSVTLFQTAGVGTSADSVIRPLALASTIIQFLPIVLLVATGISARRQLWALVRGKLSWLGKCLRLQRWRANDVELELERRP